VGKRIAETSAILKEKGWDETQIARDVRVKEVKAKLKELQVRLRAIDAHAKRTAELAVKKAERLAKPKEEAPKAEKPPEPAPEAKPKKKRRRKKERKARPAGVALGTPPDTPHPQCRHVLRDPVRGVWASAASPMILCHRPTKGVDEHHPSERPRSFSP